ncbi:hypothetical protein KIN20_020000 [Parelaphostrongylus tenuis]|uniref:Uncharacterized protein n=1 Tax=Parelaphostrongylus tenuis TaxID=148309 RepID=A0AAD5QTB1_PARTN|nr:hypothetical protein KIN20_020000 [Parelaphostrongylus tenuis]
MDIKLQQLITAIITRHVHMLSMYEKSKGMPCGVVNNVMSTEQIVNTVVYHSRNRPDIKPESTFRSCPPLSDLLSPYDCVRSEQRHMEVRLFPDEGHFRYPPRTVLSPMFREVRLDILKA